MNIRNVSDRKGAEYKPMLALAIMVATLSTAPLQVIETPQERRVLLKK
jgi:hypothetical protein